MTEDTIKAIAKLDAEINEILMKLVGILATQPNTSMIKECLLHSSLCNHQLSELLLEERRKGLDNNA